MKVTQVEKILFSPLFTSKLFLYALSGANNNRLKFELIYYILPLLYNEKIKTKLAKSNARSSLKSLLDGDVKMILINIDEALKNYNKKSREALITLSNFYPMNISSDIVISPEHKVHYSEESDIILKEYFKAAYNLGSILSKENPTKIFFNF